MRNEIEDVPENGNPYMRHYKQEEREEARKNLKIIMMEKEDAKIRNPQK